MPKIVEIVDDIRKVGDSKRTQSRKQYDLRDYELIKEYREFSSVELLARKFFAVLIIAASLGLVYFTSFSSKVKQFLTKTNTKIYTLKNKVKCDPASLLVDDVFKLVFGKLSVYDLGKCSRVSKSWAKLSSNPSLWQAFPTPRIVISQSKWLRRIPNLEIENPPALPTDIHKIIRRPCPFFPSKITQETHNLIYIPEYIRIQNVLGDPTSVVYCRVTLKNLSSLMKKTLDEDILDEFGDRALAPGWYLSHLSKVTKSDYKGADLITAYIYNMFNDYETIRVNNRNKFFGVIGNSITVFDNSQSFRYLYLRKL